MRSIAFACLSLFSGLSAEESSTRILFVRNGEVPGNNPDPSKYVYTGSGTDESLTEKGREQALACAKKLRERVESIAAIYSSDLKRAMETAEAASDELALPVELRPRLREISWGIADGQLVQKMDELYGALEDEMERVYPDRKSRWYRLPVFKGAETFNALLERGQEELADIASNHSGETILVFGHGRMLKTLIADSLDSEENLPYPKNCGIAEFTYSVDEGLRFIKIFEE